MWPPGARAFSRLPNDKKGKALGTRLKYGMIWMQMDIDSTSWKISVKLRRFEQKSFARKLVYYYIHVANFPTKGFHSKRRSFTCIFQVQYWIPSGVFWLPSLTQIARVYSWSCLMLWWNGMQVIHASFKLWSIWKRWSNINLSKIYGMWYRKSVMRKRLMRFISNIQLKHKYLTLRMQELKRAMTCVSFDDYKYFSLTFSENFDKRFFVVSC
jgi:hypothetical protein